MPQKSGFFDSIDDDERLYPAREFANYFAQIISNGVFNGGQFLNPTASGLDAVVNVSPGYAWINGYAYSVYDAPLALIIPIANSQDRIDRVILRLDTSTPVRLIKMIVVQGTPSMTPVPPALVRTGDIYDLSLAKVLVTANSTIITQNDITDERLDTNVCGLVNSLVTVDTSIFQEQWEEFMKEIQDDSYATYGYVDQKVSDVDLNYVRQPGFAKATGTSTEYKVSLFPPPVSLPDGFGVTIVPHMNNGANPTLSINGSQVFPLKNSLGLPYPLGTMIAGRPYSFKKVGSDFLAASGGGEVSISGSQLVSREYGQDGILPNQPVYTSTIASLGMTINGKVDGSSEYMAVHPDGDIILIGTTGSQTAYRFYSLSGTVLTPLVVSGYPNSTSFSGAVWTLDGKHLLVYSKSQPQLSSYSFDRNTMTFTRVSQISISETGAVNDISLAANGTHLIMATSGGGSVNNLYSILVTNGILTRNIAIAYPGGDTSYCVAFSPDSKYLAVGCSSSSNYLVFYERSGDTFTKLPALTSPHLGSPRSLAWSPDNQHLVVGDTGANSLSLYKRSDSGFVKQPTSSFSPTGRDSGLARSNNILFHPDGEYLYTAFSASFSAPLTTAIYKRRGDTYVEQQGIGETGYFGSGGRCAVWLNNGKNLLIGGQANASQYGFDFRPNTVFKLTNSFLDIKPWMSELGYTIREGNNTQVREIVTIWR
ncbi:MULTISPECIES: hypothetical protein [Paenibacillus]|uniref:Lactonase family protein with 7-bladed beta-propeller n=1 Tax=Paenibacillus pabuli TaxID=1472 RepID=A0A855Y932_9BACL|nr:MULTISPECIES: hypothetical protein [Paenibacillus]PWW37405.1 lactonase family protein with 7-bladed beta-propeller [Paenibacillus pabuli]PXW05547.1 lactonase family protein with 7-bladed beta-propeller [Paenibacillus taichungensis]